MSLSLTPLPITLPTSQLFTNFFSPSFAPNHSFHVYTAAVTPQVSSDNRHLLSLLFSKLEAQLFQVLGIHVHSGLKVYAVKEVSTVTHSTTEVEGVPYELRLRLSHSVSLLPDSVLRPEVYTILNVIFKRVLRLLGLKQLTRQPNYYDEHLTTCIPDCGLEIWPGFSVQLAAHCFAPLLNIDCVSKIVHTRTVLDELCQYKRRGGEWMEEAKAHLENRVVMARYGNRRCYRVEEIVFSMNPTQPISETEKCTYMDYYRTHYQETISIPNQPLLRSVCKLHGQTTSVYLVPELMMLTGLSRDLHSDYHTMSSIADCTSLEPRERLQVVSALAEQIRTNKAAERVLKGFGVEVGEKPVMAGAYDLSGESIFTSGLSPHPVDSAGHFQLKEGILSSVPINNWVVITPDFDQLHSVISALYSRLLALNSQVAEPRTCIYCTTNEPRTVVQTTLSEQEKPQVLVVLMTKQAKDAYLSLKKLTCTAHAVPTQVALVPIPTRRFRPTINKLGLQIQAKLGAQLWTTKPLLSFGKYLMVVGVDIHHDLTRRQQSVVGLCATVHPNLSKYYSTTAMQHMGEEISMVVGKLFLEAVQVFSMKARRPPDYIVFFRDGVAETQAESVRQFEVEAVRRACKLVDPSYSPDLIYTLVLKKTTAKFLTCDSANPRPGTLITSVVPSPNDFYLISHCASQGTTSPALYRVLYASQQDHFPLEALARLAYKLCHMYYNWEGAVKVPAPCMMAHKLAYFVGQYVRQEVNPSLRHLAFYL